MIEKIILYAPVIFMAIATLISFLVDTKKYKETILAVNNSAELVRLRKQVKDLSNVISSNQKHMAELSNSLKETKELLKEIKINESKNKIDEE